MKKIISFLFIAFISVGSMAQNLSNNDALQLIQKNAAQLNIELNDNDLPKISSAYTDATLGLTYIYVQQQYKNIRLFNIIKSTVFKKDVLQAFEGDFIADIAARANNASPKLSAIDALQKACIHLNINAPVNVVVIENKIATENKVVLNHAGVAKQNITAELVWRSDDDNKSFKLCWNISIDVLNSADYWNVRVDAATGKIIDKDNFTVYEAPNHADHKPLNTPKKNFVEKRIVNTNVGSYFRLTPPAATSASYRVIAFPKENMNVTGGVTVETNPWLKAGANNNAITYGWHYDGTNDYDITMGNNVIAYDDSINQNAPGRYVTSTTTAPTLTFNVIPVTNKQPYTSQNREFGTINLFYWNNIIHDIFYQYGFTEAGGNFQLNNLGRGGSDGDCVLAEAQDGKGTNNANFSTPADGSSGRMQMYLWTYTTTRRDGDADNGVITHEYGHGISNRLTGGPTNSSCLYNYEQGGEGWSDYFALMVTTNWANALLTDGTKKRSVGTYVVGQANTGAGIRTYPYTTNMTLNPHTYLDVADTLNNPQTTITGAHIPNATEVHYIGEVWCSALWDMTWNIIQQVGYINPNIYDAAGGGGNNIALNLVMQGLKLQKCSPGFLDSRNAILKADSILYGNIYHAAIWKAFARRGMGWYAIQGSGASCVDQTDDYEAPVYTLSGRIITPTNQIIPNTRFYSKKDNYYWKPKDSAKGYFEFDAYKYFNKTLNGARVKETNRMNGITVLDIIQIQNHLLNKNKITNPYKLIAADVNSSKTITVLDVVAIKKLILGLDTTFAGNKLWAFVDSAYQFADSTNPFPFKDSIKLTTLTANTPNQTFIGIKLGDVTSDWQAASGRQIATKDLQLLSQSSQTSLNNYEVKISATNFKNLTGLQYTLHFDNSKFELLEIRNNKLEIEHNAAQANITGNISFIWADKKSEPITLEDASNLFTLKLRLRATADSKSTTVDLSLTNDVAAIEAWDNNFNKHHITLSQKQINNPQTIAQSFIVYPNPSKGSVSITTNGVNELQIIDVTGKIVKKSLTNESTTLSNFQLSKGVYVIKALMKDGSIKNEKLLVE